MLIFAHRGGNIPENTLQVVKNSLELNLFDGIELDVNITRDNIVVLYHDNDLSKLTNGEGKIYERDYNYISKLDAGYKWPEYRDKGYKIPTLSSVLEYLKNKNVYIHLDIKNSRAIEPTILLLKKYNLINNKLLLDSSYTYINNIIYNTIKTSYSLSCINSATSIFQSIYYYIFYLLKIKFKNRDIVLFYINSFFSIFITKSLVKFFHDQNIKVGIFGRYINKKNMEYYKNIGIDICIIDL